MKVSFHYSSSNLCWCFLELTSVFLKLQAVVSEEDGMESIAHRFLSAAMKVYPLPMIHALNMTFILYKFEGCQPVSLSPVGVIVNFHA